MHRTVALWRASQTPAQIGPTLWIQRGDDKQ
jgi:hypothetical protein